MSELRNCFFCCKATFASCVKVEESYNSSTSNYSNKCENYEAVKKTILQISHYLQVPRETIIEAKGNNDSIKICEECKEISEYLGNLCCLMETTQMKINYYLNLLTDKILTKEEQIDDQLINLSNFQKIFHQKCLTKLSQVDANPILKFTKCQVPRISDNQFFVEIMGDSNDNDEILEDDDDDKPNVFTENDEDFSGQPEDLFTEDINNYEESDLIQESVDAKVEIGSTPKSVRKSRRKVVRNITCDYCPLTFNSSKNKQTHITAVHMKNNVNIPGSHVIKPCEYCGAMISSRNLSKHRKRHVGHIPKVRRKDPKVVKFKRCETCKNMFEMGWKMREHLRESKDCGANAKFRCSNCGRIFSRKCNLQRHVVEACEITKEGNQVKVEIEMGGENCC